MEKTLSDRAHDRALAMVDALALPSPAPCRHRLEADIAAQIEAFSRREAEAVLRAINATSLDGPFRFADLDVWIADSRRVLDESRELARRLPVRRPATLAEIADFEEALAHALRHHAEDRSAELEMMADVRSPLTGPTDAEIDAFFQSAVEPLALDLAA